MLPTKLLDPSKVIPADSKKKKTTSLEDDVANLMSVISEKLIDMNYYAGDDSLCHL